MTRKTRGRKVRGRATLALCSLVLLFASADRHPAFGAGKGSPRTTATPTATATPILTAYSSAVRADSPAVYYRMDEASGSTAIDQSGNGRNGSYSGTVTYGAAGGTGDGDKAISLPGVSGSYVNSPSLAATAAFTLECWVKPNNYLASGQLSETLFATSLSASSFVAYVPPVQGGTIAGRFVVRMGGSLTFSTQHTYAAGSWYHVVYTWDGTTQNIYVNGVLDATGSATATTAPPSWGGVTYLGADVANTTASAPLQGTLDDPAIYAKVLSAAQVQAHYSAATSATPTPTNTIAPTLTRTPTPTATSTPSPTPTTDPIPTSTSTPGPTPTLGPSATPTSIPSPTPTRTAVPTPTITPTPTATNTPIPPSPYSSAVLADSPAMYYRLDESGGNTALDSSGKGNNGKYNGTVTYGAAGGTGDGDTGVSFPGVSTAYVNSPTMSFVGPFTLECWVKPNNYLATGQQAETLFSTSLSGSNSFAYVPQISTSTVAGQFVIHMGGSQNFATTHVYPAGTWYHVVYTWDGTTQNIYVNGILDATGSATTTTASPTWGGVTYLGDAPKNTSFPAPLQGTFDDAATYTTALSAARVQAHYAAATGNLSTPTPTPVAGTAVALGSYVDSVNAWDGSPLDQFAQSVGKMPAVSWFPVNWGDPPDSSFFNPALMDVYRSRGIVPLLSWEPSTGPPYNNINQPTFNWKAIASGTQDAYITQFANDAKNYGYPMLIRMFHELNGTWYPWGYQLNGNTNTADEVSAWRHVVTIFRSVGATNVQFIWCPSTGAGTANIAALYPGDAYVDWVGMDGYNSSATSWLTLYNRFQPMYNALQSLTTKPMVIVETGSIENTAASPTKADWITQGFLTTMPQYFPKVRAVLWYNSLGTGGQNYQVNTSSSSLSAYQKVVANSYYQASMPVAAALPTATPGPCPSGWNCADIGSPSLAGTQYLNGTTLSVTGSGVDIWNPPDQFHYVWRTLTGDGSVSAYVASQTQSSTWAKAGVMLRQSTDPGAPFYAVYVSPGQGIAVQYRATQGAQAVQAADLTGQSPAYLKVTQSAGTYTAYTSTDGVTWTPITGSTESITMSAPVLAGMVVTSHLAGEPSVARFQSIHAGP